MMLLDYFGFFCWISRKMDKISKPGQFWGPTSRRRDPTQQRRSTPRRDREGEGLYCSVAVLHRGVALFTDMCFCHVLLFRYSKDLPIGLMRTL